MRDTWTDEQTQTDEETTIIWIGRKQYPLTGITDYHETR
jgi:hypothetical protein